MKKAEEKKWLSRCRAGFTLVEMLVVIGLIGMLAAALAGSFTHIRKAAWQSHASNQVREVATAFNIYLHTRREWSDKWLDKTEMDPDVCKEFQRKNMLDVTTYDLNTGTINRNSLDKFGLLDPWGRAALKRNLTGASEGTRVDSGGTIADHRIQFRLDKNYDGYVDAQDWPAIPGGARVRASVLVWSRGPDGQDDFLSGGRYPGGDDRLSWDHKKSLP